MRYSDRPLIFLCLTRDSDRPLLFLCLMGDSDRPLIFLCLVGDSDRPLIFLCLIRDSDRPLIFLFDELFWQTLDISVFWWGILMDPWYSCVWWGILEVNPSPANRLVLSVRVPQPCAFTLSDAFSFVKSTHTLITPVSLKVMMKLHTSP